MSWIGVAWFSGWGDSKGCAKYFLYSAPDRGDLTGMLDFATDFASAEEATAQMARVGYTWMRVMKVEDLDAFLVLKTLERDNDAISENLVWVDCPKHRWRMIDQNNGCTVCNYQNEKVRRGS